MKILWKLPGLERPAVIEAVRFSFENSQVMNRLEMNVLAVPIPSMNGDDFGVTENLDEVDSADDRQEFVSVFGRHGIIVGVKTDERQRIGRAKFDPPGLEILFRQRSQGSAFFLEQFPDRFFLAGADVLPVSEALLGQVLIKTLEIRKLRNRHHEVASDVSDGVFDPAFLISLTDLAEMVLEQEVRLNP